MSDLRLLAIDLSTNRHQLVPPSTGDSLLKVPFSFGDASPTLIGLALAGATVFTATIVIQTPFNGVGAMLQLGDAGQRDRLLTASQNNPALAAEYETNPGYTYTNTTELFFTITPGAGCTQGAGYVLLEI